ncbi:MAG: hypothetical protein ACREQI_12540 [Candidatus Binataceae bacterium]
MAQAPDKRESSSTEAREIHHIERAIDRANQQLRGFENYMSTMMLVATCMMAVATGLSAWATWRYEKVTERIFTVSDRPYIGVQKISLALDDPKLPYASIDYTNFGTVPSEESTIQAWASVDGRVVSFDPLHRGLGQKIKLDLGALSPHTPHLFAAYFPEQYVDAVLKGRSQFKVTVDIHYKDAAKTPYCYRMNFRYFPPLKSFDPDGGSSECWGDIDQRAPD